MNIILLVLSCLSILLIILGFFFANRAGELGMQVFNRRTTTPVTPPSLPNPPLTPAPTPTPAATPQGGTPVVRRGWPAWGWVLLVVLALMFFPKLLSAGIDWWTSDRITGLPSANVLTLDSAPLDHVSGRIWLHYDGHTHGPSNTVRIISLEGNYFNVVFKDGMGNDWPFVFIGGKGGVWSTGSESGEFTIQSVGGRSNWVGTMTEKGQRPVNFTMAFEVR